MEELCCTNEEKVQKGTNGKLRFKSKRYFLKDLFKNSEDENFESPESNSTVNETHELEN